MFKKLLVPKLRGHFSRKDWLKAMFILVGVGASNGYSQTTDSTTIINEPKDQVEAPATNGKVITGQVLSKADNAPVVGAIVFIKGTNVATETDENGNYTITVPAESANGTLVIKYDDDSTTELPLATTTNFNVQREEDVTKLETIQIIGYGTQEKEDVTGAISSVKSEDLNRVVVTDPAQAIQGRAAGVTVTQNTGAPGAPLQIRVRGTGTIGNSSPLYVVNGMPMDNISFLNSNDIESIDILKDASSAAVYGARAANGVVLVTTKKGSKKKSVTTFNYLTGVSEAWRRANVVDGKGYATLRNEASVAGGGPILYNLDTIGTGTDWQDQIFRKGKMNSYSLSTSGGNEKATYYISGSYLDQTGIVKNSDFQRFNVSANGDYQVSKRLKLSAFTVLGLLKGTQSMMAILPTHCLPQL
jgi:TonB-dependent starch-binding outer membrane protein SusC